MHKLKENPDDFIVNEVPIHDIKDTGKYVIYRLKKRNYTTLRALEHIAYSLHIPLKNIGFAGTKDKKAVTTQYISIKGSRKRKISGLELKDISLEFEGYLDEPISLGDLKGNEFIIKVSNIDTEQIGRLKKKPKIMPNYFGEQRFSKNNKEIGKNIIRSMYKEAIELIRESNSDYSGRINSHLKGSPNDYVGAIKLIPTKLLRLYVNSYQSYIWNETLRRCLKDIDKDTDIPLVGFGTEVKNPRIENVIEDIMDKEKLSYRDFINKEISSLSLEGQKRPAFVKIKDFSIISKEEKSMTMKFSLRKGSYATVAIKHILKPEVL